jgi:hypothetical protein
MARHLLQALRHGVPMDGAERHNFQDQQVQGALGQIGFRGHYHASRFYTLDYDV